MTLFYWIAPAFLIFSCVTEEVDPSTLISKRFPMESWPDSAYIATLDQQYNPNLYEKEKKKYTTAINLQSVVMNNPLDKKKIPQSVTSSSNQKSPNIIQRSEEFIASFVNALDLARSDPSNTRILRQHQVGDEKNIRRLMLRVYGQQSGLLPNIIIDSQLKSLNPDADLNDLKPGDKIWLPVIN
jgi:hypothetical protein